MRFKVSTSISLVCVMIMFFGVLVSSTDDGGKALMEKMLLEGKNASLQEDKYPEVNELMTTFMNSRQNADMEKLGTCVDDITMYKEEDLKQAQKLIKNVDGIKCYTIDGWDDDSYVVYLYYEYTVDNVDCKIPNLVRDLVGKDKDGKLRVITKTSEPKAVKFVRGTESNEQVIELIKKVDASIKELKEKNSSAKVFIETLENFTKKKKAEAEKKKEDNGDKEEDGNKKEDADANSGNGEQKPDEQKPDEQKTDEQKQGEQKPDEQKPDEQKSDEQKSDEQKSDEQKSDEQKSDEQKQAEQKTENN